MPEKPKILNQAIVAQSRLFTVQDLHLRFSNGQERHFERLKARSQGAVLIVALLNEDTVLLAREYAAGVDKYELAFPKGIIEKDESFFDAANRELREELGFSAAQFTLLRSLTLAPGYMEHRTHIVLAEHLTPDKMDGDEPEPIEVVPWPLKEIDTLLARDDFTEARSYAALWLLKRHLLQRNSSQ